MKLSTAERNVTDSSSSARSKTSDGETEISQFTVWNSF